MPTYEYRCPNGHDFEKFFRSMSSAQAETAIACPVCGAIALRQLSSAGLMFKGTGFYLTDYGKNAHQKKGGAEGPKADGAKAEGATGEGAKAEGAKGEGGKSEGTSSGSEGGSSEAKKGESKSSEAKPAESKPAAPPKSSSGE